MLLFTFCSSFSLTRSGEILITERTTVAQDQQTQISTESVSNQIIPPEEWLDFTGAVLASIVTLLAVWVGFWQWKKTKQEERMAELRKYQYDQIVPFLEKLEKTLNASHKALYKFSDPEIFYLWKEIESYKKFYNKQTYDEWLNSIVELTDYRFLVLAMIAHLPLDKTKNILLLLKEFIDKSIEIQKNRQIWMGDESNHFSDSCYLSDKFKSYIEKGCELMIEIWDSISSISDKPVLLTEEDKNQFIKIFSEICSETGFSTFQSFPPSVEKLSWIGIWSINLERLTCKNGKLTIEQKMTELMNKLNELKQKIKDDQNSVQVNFNIFTIRKSVFYYIELSATDSNNLKQCVDKQITAFYEEVEKPVRTMIFGQEDNQALHNTEQSR